MLLSALLVGFVMIPVDDADRAVRSALAAARIERAVALARKDYTSSDFAGCIARIRAIEDEIPARVASGSFAEAKAAYLWLGLCEAVSGDARAASHLQLSRKLPGPPPEAGLLPPSVRALYDDDTAPGCTFPAQLGRVIDGEDASKAVKLNIGPHLFGSVRMVVDYKCEIHREADERSARASLSSDERRDVALLTSLASLLNTDQLLLKDVRFDAKTGAFTDVVEAPPVAQAESDPLLWFFTGAGVAAGLAVAVGVAIAISTPSAQAPSARPVEYRLGF
jgi:hypothetical protein